MSSWYIAFQYGDRPGEYSRRGVAEVEAFDIYDALATDARAGACVNSRIVYVAEDGAMRNGRWRPRRKADGGARMGGDGRADS